MLRDRQTKIQNLNGKGFTLIELLVTMIIIGILAAIALPSFLNQANKARYSEAKTYIGTMSRLQQAYYLEKKTFTDVIGNLNLGVNTTTSNFTYSVISGDVNGNSSPIQLDQIVTNVATPTSPNVNAFVSVVGIPGVVRIDTVFCVANSPNIFINPGSMNSVSQTMICPSNFFNE
ncbi:prepilin-type N-terminal cleavage/methylation domain-containing protein [Pseudanabaena sp. UWO310]|nr:prepilin-type N-terminal cleavage/methylation domain-containing protein [Pseudanabaena sp. UWO310]